MCRANHPLRGLGSTAKLALATLLFATLQGCATLSNEDPVTVGPAHLRTGGENARQPLSDMEAKLYAEAVLPFARVASRAYCDYLRDNQAQPAECDSTAPMVEQDGWQLLFDSRDALAAEDQYTRLTFLAFYRVHLNDPSTGDIVFGFRGTKFSYASDWNANLRWVTRFLPGSDQYDVLYCLGLWDTCPSHEEARRSAPI